MTDTIREAIKTLEKLKGQPCSWCNNEWGSHGLVAGHDCPGEAIDKAIADLKQVIDDGQLPYCCSICGRYGCMNDHGYGGPGPDAY